MATQLITDRTGVKGYVCSCLYVIVLIKNNKMNFVIIVYTYTIPLFILRRQHDCIMSYIPYIFYIFVQIGDVYDMIFDWFMIFSLALDICLAIQIPTKSSVQTLSVGCVIPCFVLKKCLLIIDFLDYD